MAAHLNAKIHPEEAQHAKIDRYIVDRVRAALSVLKQCLTEEQCVEYHIVLGAIAPEREVQSCKEGKLRSVAERLGVTRGYLFAHSKQRPRAFDQAVTRRAAFDSACVPTMGCGPSMLDRPLKVGEKALSHGRPCKVVEIDYGKGTCKLAFSEGGVNATRTYSSLGRAKGGARIARPPLLLRPQPREMRWNEKASAARPKVEEFFNEHGARSPEIRDQVRRRHGVALYEVTQALILYSTYAALYAAFVATHPMVRISFSLFKSLRPWYVRRAKREVCLCRQCENFKCYKEILLALVKVLDRSSTGHTLELDHVSYMCDHV